MIISPDTNYVKFGGDDYGSVGAPLAVVPRGSKTFYEVIFKKDVSGRSQGCSRIGWVTTTCKISDQSNQRGCTDVGYCEHSYAFDGQNQVKYHAGNINPWGSKFEASGDRVLGVAVDMQNGQLLYGLDGNWAPPMGCAFQIDTNVNVYPALSGRDVELDVNFGESDFVFGPPDPSFEKLCDVVACRADDDQGPGHTTERGRGGGAHGGRGGQRGRAGKR